MNFTRKLREWQHQTWTQVSWKGQRNRTKCVISPWNKLLLAQRERNPNQTTRNKLEGRKNQSRSGPDGISHLRPGRPTNRRRRRRTRERDSYSVEEEWIPSIRFRPRLGGLAPLDGAPPAPPPSGRGGGGGGLRGCSLAARWRRRRRLGSRSRASGLRLCRSERERERGERDGGSWEGKRGRRWGKKKRRKVRLLEEGGILVPRQFSFQLLMLKK